MSLIDLFYEVGTLKKLKRSYYLNVLQDTESVAEHSHRCCIIAYILAKEVGADPLKAMIMAVFHDIPETRTGDANWAQKPYVQHDEDKAIFEQLGPYGRSTEDILEYLKEYEERNTMEAKIAKDADILEYILSLKELEMTGNKEATRRLESDNTDPSYMYTDIGKEYAREIKKSDPTKWSRNDLKKSLKKYQIKAGV